MEDLAAMEDLEAVSRKIERDRIAEMIEDFTPDQIRLAAGEMTAQEMRTVQAIQRWWVFVIRSSGEQLK